MLRGRTMFKKNACRQKQANQDKQTEKGTIPMLILQKKERNAVTNSILLSKKKYLHKYKYTLF